MFSADCEVRPCLVAFLMPSKAIIASGYALNATASRSDASLGAFGVAAQERIAHVERGGEDELVTCAKVAPEDSVLQRQLQNLAASFAIAS